MDILTVILTSVFSFVALFVLTKLMGHKQVSQLDFFDYITGITIGSIAAELATVFEEQMPKAYLELKKLGEPVIVKFCVPFAKIASYKKQDIIFHFVCNIVAKFIWDFNYFVLFDGQVICDIPPENILEVIPCLNSVL
ncbi:MAG: hypothetical protein ACOX5C_04250 [Acutalibacteraceae bacterium]|jgi:hypothetical protein